MNDFRFGFVRIANDTDNVPLVSIERFRESTGRIRMWTSNIFRIRAGQFSIGADAGGECGVEAGQFDVCGYGGVESWGAIWCDSAAKRTDLSE